ncbi:MAG: hypothetical protein KAS30_01700 [Candidatus Diapherotrites archaeon]|nr:hypothetical protein [Candidatus Diapherotrites archaeon]
MEKADLHTLFKPGTQKHRMVQAMVACGSISNGMFAKMNILAYAQRKPEINKILLPHKFEMITVPIEGSCWKSEVIELGG